MSKRLSNMIILKNNLKPQAVWCICYFVMLAPVNPTNNFLGPAHPTTFVFVKHFPLTIRPLS